MSSKTTGPTSQKPGGGGAAARSRRAASPPPPIIIAFFANLAIAIAKTVVGLITGSASMLAESAHSWADTGNQVLLFVADKRSRKPADESHPLGYGRESYVWSLMAAFGLFFAGAIVSILEGVRKLTESGWRGRRRTPGPTWCSAQRSCSRESRSSRRSGRPARRPRSWNEHIVEHALHTSDPMLRAVFAEDSAALVGLVIAACGVFLHQVTGNAVYDAIGSIRRRACCSARWRSC